MQLCEGCECALVGRTSMKRVFQAFRGGSAANKKKVWPELEEAEPVPDTIRGLSLTVDNVIGLFRRTYERLETAPDPDPMHNYGGWHCIGNLNRSLDEFAFLWNIIVYVNYQDFDFQTVPYWSIDHGNHPFISHADAEKLTGFVSSQDEETRLEMVRRIRRSGYLSDVQKIKEVLLMVWRRLDGYDDKYLITFLDPNRFADDKEMVKRFLKKILYGDMRYKNDFAWYTAKGGNLNDFRSIFSQDIEKHLTQHEIQDLARFIRIEVPKFLVHHAPAHAAAL